MNLKQGHIACSLAFFILSTLFQLFLSSFFKIKFKFVKILNICLFLKNNYKFANFLRLDDSPPFPVYYEIRIIAKNKKNKGLIGLFLGSIGGRLFGWAWFHRNQREPTGHGSIGVRLVSLEPSESPIKKSLLQKNQFQHAHFLWIVILEPKTASLLCWGCFLCLIRKF